MKSPRPEGRWTAGAAWLASLFPAILALGSKGLKSYVLHAPALHGPLFAASDLLFAGCWPLLGLLPARTLRPAWLRTAWALLFAVASSTMLVLFVVDLGFFLKTGSVLDGFMLRYGWTQHAELWQVLRSELDPFSTAALLLGPWVPAIPMGLALLRSWRARLERLDARLGPAPTHLSVALTMLGVLGLLARSAHPPETLGTLNDSPPQALLQAALYGVGWHRAAGEDAPPPASVYAPRRLVEETPAPPIPYNVVLVVMESTRASSTTLHDPKLETTPFLADLAHRGRWAKRMYTVIPHTSKALVGILCSLTPWPLTPILEAERSAFPGGCLARLLRERGYATAFFQTATETFEHRAALVDNAGYEDFFERDDMPTGFHRSSYFGYEDRAMLGPVLRWVKEHRDTPFFLTVLTLTTHHNYVVPRGFPRRRFGYEGDYENYLNTLRYVDEFSKQLHQGIERLGLLDRTLFVFVGDHGEGFGEHGRYQHDNTIYEEGLHVPFVISGPDVPSPGHPIEGLRQITDVMPTIADLLGYRVEGHLDGRSVFTPPWRQAIYASCWYRNYCMAQVTKRLKFIYHYGRRPSEVFDLSDDPLERRDLWERGLVSHAKLLSAITAMRQWKWNADRWWRHAPNLANGKWVTRTPTSPERTADIVFGGRIRLRGLDGPRPDPPRQDTEVELRYHFEALESPGRHVRLFVHLMDEGGQLVQNLDHVPAERSYEVGRWQPGEFIVDRHRFRISTTLPAGTYRLLVGFYDSVTQQRLPPKGSGLPIDAGEQAVEVLRFHLPAVTRASTGAAAPDSPDE